MSEKYLWLVFVALAGLSWGTYVPIIFYGGSELVSPRAPVSGRLMAILCVGGAYFVIGVMLPLILFLTGQQPWPEMKTTGLVFSSLAGVAGAVGAICVVFASKAAVDAARAHQPPLPIFSYRMYIAPLIFGLAPVINVLVSSIWHPKPGNAMNFELHLPGWKLWLGIVLVGLGAALVLFSKEEQEAKPLAHRPPAAITIAGAAPIDGPRPMAATIVSEVADVPRKAVHARAARVQPGSTFLHPCWLIGHRDTVVTFAAPVLRSEEPGNYPNGYTVRHCDVCRRQITTPLMS